MRLSHISAGWNCYCLLGLLLLSFFFASAQPPDRPSPQTLSELLNAIETVMEQEQIPGLMLAIVTKDSVIFSGGLGYSDLATNRKVDGKQKFRLGSTTKLLVAMSMLHLVHNKKISLEAKLKDIAPEIPFHNPWEETHPLRIINLLEHTTGFSDPFMNKSINLTDHDRTGLDVLQFFEEQLVCRIKPGTTPGYNNTNYTVLGYVIEKLTGKDWPEYIREHVLLPIGMHHTDFRLRLPQTDEYAKGYFTRGGMQVPVPASFTLNSNGAHGSMNSCADDMAKLTRFFLNDWRLDTTQWLPKSYLLDMETVHTTLAAEKGLKNGYGLGNHIETWHPKATFRGHGGTIQGFMAHMIYDRERGFGMAIAKNGGHNDAHIAMLITDFLTRHMPVIEPIEKQLPKDSIQAYLGYYKTLNVPAHYGFIQDIVRDVFIGANGNQVMIKPFRGWTMPLTHVGQLKFRRSFEHDALYVFGQDEEGNKVLMSSAPQAGSHLVKTSSVSVFFKRGLALLGLLAMVLSLISGVISIVLIVFKRIRRRQIPMMIFPMLATLSLAFGLKPLIQFELNYFLFTEPNAVTLTIFIGTLFFGIFSFVGLWFLYSRWNSLESVWTKTLITFSIVGTAAVAGVFLVHGMIGAMVWGW